MINNKKILAVIPARAGSKGIKDKNIVDICGMPLIAYTIKAAKNSKYIDDVVISTDGDAIAEVARSYGADVPFMRPQELASDTSKTIDSIVYTIDKLRELDREYDVLCLLQPTSPLRTEEDVDAALEKFAESSCTSLASVSEVADHPILMRTIEDDGKMKTLLDVSSTCRRQDMPRYYRVNGAIYINLISEISLSTSFNDNSLPYVMDRSHSLDIDEPDDVLRARLMLTH